MAVDLQSAQLSDVFPFHVAFDNQLRILQVGRSWPFVSADVRVGADMGACFTLLRPSLPLEPEVLQRLRGSGIVIESRASGLPLKGQIVAQPGAGGWLFVGSPLARSLDDLTRFGLTFDHLPPHESATDFFFLLQAKEAALAEARTMSAQLTLKSGELAHNAAALTDAVQAREAARKAAADREASVRAVVDSALDAVITIDPLGVITLWNAQAEVVFGWTKEEALGRQLAELIVPPVHREAHRQGLRRFLDTGEARVLNRRIEITALRRDGEEFPVELAIAPIEGQSQLGFSAFVRDITVRRRSERLLRLQAEVPHIFEAASNVSEAATKLLESICHALDWDEGELWLEEPADGLLRAVGTWRRTEAGPATRNGGPIAAHVITQGRPVWFPAVPSPDPSSSTHARVQTALGLPITVAGRAVGALACHTQRAVRSTEDVSEAMAAVASLIGQFIERRQAEQERRQVDLRLRSVVDNMLEGLVLVGLPDLAIVEANPAFAEIFGYTLDELIGTSIVDLMPDRPEYRDPDNLALLYQRSVGRISEHEGRRRNGKEFPLQLQVYEVTAPDGPLIAAHVRDLSQEQQADRLKKQFVAAISHELRTPLTAIRGSLGLLALGALGELPAEAVEVVAMAERNTTRLVGIINDLLDIERLQAGMLSLSRSAFPIDRAITRAVESVTVLADDNGIRITEPRSGIEAWGDEARVVQVLVNLLGNAIKFSPRDSAVEIHVTARKSEITVQVRDQGRGIPEEMQSVIFERFRQVEASDSRKKGGSGVGLAICRGIIAQHGGAIGADSRLGEGATFWFTLPAKPLSAVPQFESAVV